MWRHKKQTLYQNDLDIYYILKKITLIVNFRIMVIEAKEPHLKLIVLMSFLQDLLRLHNHNYLHKHDV